MVSYDFMHNHLLSRGYAQDRFGYYKKPGIFNQRFKLTSHSLRFESLLNTNPPRWVRVRSAYLRDIRITDQGLIAGMSFKGCQGRIPRR